MLNVKNDSQHTVQVFPGVVIQFSFLCQEGEDLELRCIIRLGLDNISAAKLRSVAFL